MTTILVVDDMPIFREPIAASLRLAGFDVQTAGDGRQALDLIAQKCPSLLLLDLAMPVMDGIATLTALRANPETRALPVILLTAHSDRQRVVDAARLGIAEYFLKSQFSLQELLKRVQKHLAPNQLLPATPAAPVSPDPATPPAPAAPQRRLCAPAVDPNKLILLTRDQTRARLHAIKGAQACAGVVAQVLALTSSPNADIADLVRVLEADPILAARVLQLSNSPMYRQKYNRLSSISEAVRNVGTRAVQNMAITISIFQTFPPDAADGFNTLRCWQHSFAVAAILRTLLTQANESDRERVALIGLCHELGEIVLRQHFVAEFSRILAHAQRTNQPLATVEASALSMRHSELVNEIITRVGLPANIALPIVRFHEGALGRESDDGLAVRALQIANALAHGMLLSPHASASLAPIARADLKRAFGGDDLSLNLHQLRSEVLTATNALARLPLADEQRLIKPLFPPSNHRVWYARHNGYAALDPLHAALDLIASVHVSDVLPQTAAELANTDLLLVAAPFIEAAPLNLAALRDLPALPGYCGQPIIALTGNPVGAAPIKHVDFVRLPVSLADLADRIARAPNSARAA